MGLTSDAIVTAAHRLLADYGLHDVTMRRLAAELGVQPGALYYHVPNKQELLRRVAQQLLAPLGETGERAQASCSGSAGWSSPSGTEEICCWSPTGWTSRSRRSLRSRRL